MNSLEIIIDYLKSEPRFRERKNKDRGMVNILIKKHGIQHIIDNKLLTKEKIVDIVQDYAVLDRCWRKALSEDESLRGSDYGEKQKLEDMKKVELGYNVSNNHPSMF